MYGSAFMLSWREIRHNPLRSGLTALGIIIGVAAVIILVTLGNGARERVTSDISGLGTNLLIFVPGVEQRQGPPTPAPAFDDKDVEALRQQISGVLAVAPTNSTVTNVVYGNSNHSTTIMGTNNDYLIARNHPLASGRSFSTTEMTSGKSVCIIGQTVKDELFGRQAPLGAKLRLGKISCQVIGLLDSKGGSAFGGDQDDMILVPLRMVQRRMAGNRDINMLFVSAADEASTDRVRADIAALLRERRNNEPGEEANFITRDMREFVEIANSTTSTLTAFLAAIAGISLLVGGIGIMNIMLVSVTERTREIGIRLAIGALERDVLVQFLIEAVVLSLMGGATGVALGLGISYVGAELVDVPFNVSPSIIFIALGFSAFVGIVFGYFPARRAARLDPIDALRYE